MDFELTKQQELLIKTVGEFAKKEIVPLEQEIEGKNEVPEDLIRKLGKLGVLGIPVDKKYGGMGGTYLDLSLAVEELARVNGAVAFMVAVNYLGVITIEHQGTEKQKEKWLPRLVSGECLGAFSFTEHSTGSDPKEIYATARLNGDHYVCNGRKGFTTGATYNGPVILFLRTGEAGQVTAFVAEKNTKGYSTPVVWPLVGLKGMKVVDIQLDDFIIPVENRLNKEGAGFSVLLDTISVGKVDVACAALGMAQRALDESIKYAKEKTMRGKPIGVFQMVQNEIAEMAVEVEAARWLLRRTMHLIDQKKATLADCAKAKYFCAKTADDVCHRAMTVHGGYGYTTEFKIEQIWRDAKFCAVVEGNNVIQKVLIARGMLGI
jgi:alkylation response protein AidB-like acyl-CoA dehydrogenase